VGLSPSFQNYTEEKLWEFERNVRAAVHEGTLRGDGGTIGVSPITVKSGPYAVMLIDDLDIIVDGLFQASSTSAMLINLGQNGDTHEKCASLYQNLGDVMRLNGKRVRFEEWETVWKSCEL